MTDTRLALSEVRGPFNDLNEKLSGEDGATVWLPALKRFLRKENPWEKASLVQSILVPHPAFVVYPTPFIRNRSWRNRIEACKFVSVDSDIWKYLRWFVDIEEEDPSSVNIVLDGFEEYMKSDNVEKFQAENKKSAISLARFLSLCEHYPDVVREYSLVYTRKILIGQCGYPRALQAYARDGRLRLYLPDRRDDWSPHCRFPSTLNVSSEIGTGNFGT